ncbi:MAG: biopolymer transporter ExbB [Pseudomonadota bacterium]
MMLDREREPHFSQPIRQVLSMVVILVLFGVGVALIYDSVAPVFLASPWLNGFIVAVFVVGVIACFWQVLVLTASVNWIEGFALDRPGHEFTQSPRLLASLAAMLKDQRARSALSSTSTRSILDSVATRLDEARDITRYIINLLIFLGLLGTFYGLATTVPAVVDTIRSLGVQDGEEGIAVFDRLMSGLEDQLGGMGTAFASSLLGLAGSLVVGMLELFAGHGQNRFYMELEEWLSSITRIGVISGDGEGRAGADAAIASILEQTVRQVGTLQGMVASAEEKHAKSEARLTALVDGLGQLTTVLSDRLSPDEKPAVTPEVMDRIAAGQDRIAAALSARGEENGGLDAEAQARLRSIDLQLLRILEEISTGRQDSISEIRSDLNTLSRTIAALAEHR